MTNKRIRYLLARLRSHEERGVELPELPPGFQESFESQEAFRGWVNYHVTWDVSPANPWTVFSLSKSREQEWHETLLGVVPEIPLEAGTNGEQGNL